MIRLDGRVLSATIKSELAEKVTHLKNDKNIVPGLVVLLVGEDPASQVYVRNKEKMAQEVGFHSVVERLPETIEQEALLERIKFYNQDDTCHGILVQLPLPKHIDEQLILTAIAPHKDVDGFHPTNVGNFTLGNESTVACTPAGIIALLDAHKIDIAGKVAVVVGRSNIVGKPIANMLLQRDATVIMTHSKTKDLANFTRQADILIVAIGRGHFITKEHIKPNAVVVDVGMNRSDDGKLIGDVAPDVTDCVSALTPVPGGVGPMTITMLLHQTYLLAEKYSNTAQ